MSIDFLVFYRIRLPIYNATVFSFDSIIFELTLKVDVRKTGTRAMAPTVNLVELKILNTEKNGVYCIPIIVDFQIRDSEVDYREWDF